MVVLGHFVVRVSDIKALDISENGDGESLPVLVNEVGTAAFVLKKKSD